MSPKRRVGEPKPTPTEHPEVSVETSMSAFDERTRRRLVHLSQCFTPGRNKYPEGTLGVDGLSVVHSSSPAQEADTIPSSESPEIVSGVPGSVNFPVEPGMILAYGVGSRMLGVLPGVELPENVQRITGPDRFGPPPQSTN